MNLEVGDIVLCTVDRIVGTVVFVKLEDQREGSIILSEIAPGRIRNLRDYVVPKKKIVCKILRMDNDRIDLSLRRVTQKEKKEVMEQNQLEKSYENILKSVLKEKANEIIVEISKQEGVYSYLQNSKESPADLEKKVGKEDAKRILEILNSQKEKKSVIKREINMTSTEPNGLSLIKENLEKIKDAEIMYISAGKYVVKTEAKDPKTADNKIKEIIDKIEKNIKGNKIEFRIKGK
jgi:translation initiation factor 2 alpha subunit (eIF-2alpha)